MAVLLANPDGTVYHRYGGRSGLSPMSMEGLVDLMKSGLQSHTDYLRHPSPPAQKPPLYLPQLANEQLQARIAPMFGCFHCHYAREAEQYLALEAGTWTPDQFWIFPEPKRLGLEMNQVQQAVVQAVLPDSPATKAGLKPGDHLQTLNGTPVLTKYDIQWILNQLEDKTQPLPFTLFRDNKPIAGHLQLGETWKVGDPADYAWRVRNVYTEHMSKFLPAPGFTGDLLTPAELESNALPANSFALHITQLNYGTHLAGVRRGDIVLSADNKTNFATTRDFYAFCESLRRSGRDLRLRLLRQGEQLSLMVSQSHLNYSRVEKAPRAVLGFIVQQLPGTDGLRVGNVNDGCGAELAGVKVGDRIVALDYTRLTEAQALRTLLDNKTPGELITLDVTRDGRALQMGFMLSGEDKSRSEIARLTAKPTRPGQRITALLTIKLPHDKHIYSMHRRSLGVPTQLEFRGKGFKLIGPTEEPPPKKFDEDSVAPSWILDGEVQLKQILEVTNPDDFQLLIQIYAQVCDEQHCHEFRAVVENDGTEPFFTDYRGHFDRQPKP
ncbi:MAG: PDZ domain-containing protein [Verrucomicrobia bacterium]|nr:PDZ domain-containing protein [Verrucomicrobiota bacterium]MDA1006992.1 PDZ domain-containing protein [Verrucomicrobiota bacterium]